MAPAGAQNRRGAKVVAGTELLVVGHPLRVRSLWSPSRKITVPAGNVRLCARERKRQREKGWGEGAFGGGGCGVREGGRVNTVNVWA
eukprot:6189705-Pleurochrysis_carterae.AAC.1